MELIYGNAVEVVTAVVARLLITVLAIAGTWLIDKLAKNQKLKHIEKGVELLTKAAQTTVMELQQVMVEPLKEAAINGKLTDDAKIALKEALQSKTRQKITPAVIDLLTGAGYDIDALIQGAGEALIYEMHAAQPIGIPVDGFLDEPFVEDPVAPEG